MRKLNLLYLLYLLCTVVRCQEGEGDGDKLNIDKYISSYPCTTLTDMKGSIGCRGNISEMSSIVVLAKEYTYNCCFLYFTKMTIVMMCY